MTAIADALSKKLPLLIIFMSLLTYFSPVYWKVSAAIPSILLGVVIFFTGLSMNVTALKEVTSKKRELVIATLLKWTLTVIISLLLANLWFANDPQIAAGLILSGTVPSATAATVYTFLAGGNTSLVIAASLLDVVLSPIVTPLALNGFTTEHALSFFSLLQSFLKIVVLPLGIGILIRRSAPQLVHHAKPLTKLGSSFALLMIVHTIVGGGKAAISAELGILPLIALATLIQVVVPMGLAYFLSKKLNMNEADSRATMFQVGLCNTALAAILAYTFIGELGAIAPILNMIFNLSIGAYLSDWFAKKDIQTSELNQKTNFDKIDIFLK